MDYEYLRIPGVLSDYACNKDRSAIFYARYFLARCQRMFTYKNLPNTIPSEVLDRYLMLNGIACITDYNGELYVFGGNLGGKQDVYYRPTKFIISNPHLSDDGFFKEAVVLGDEKHTGVLMRNDTEWVGLMPMIGRYSFLLAENTITMRLADVMLRITSLLSAPTDKEKVAAEVYLRDLEAGKMGVIGEQPFFDGVRMQSPPSNNGSYLTQFIELHQYLMGSFYNEVGLSANYNMKREAIGTGESSLDQDALLPLCENMLKSRRDDLAKVNEMYGTSIEVDFSSSWKLNQTESTLQVLTQASQLVTSGPSPANNGVGSEFEDTMPAEDDVDTTSQLAEESGDEKDELESGKDQVESGEEQLESGEDSKETNDLADKIETLAKELVDGLVEDEKGGEDSNESDSDREDSVSED